MPEEHSYVTCSAVMIGVTRDVDVSTSIQSTDGFDAN